MKHVYIAKYKKDVFTFGSFKNAYEFMMLNGNDDTVKFDDYYHIARRAIMKKHIIQLVHSDGYCFMIEKHIVN